ncbi:hypothetical protein SAMN05444166_1553 [Singulisphaera sp. GP187]|nr:hypothetical protein SAMN05444166_1553 [Singulisphaera sp. GP187]
MATGETQETKGKHNQERFAPAMGKKMARALGLLALSLS